MVKDSPRPGAGRETARRGRSDATAMNQLYVLMEYAPASIAMFNRNMEYLAATRRWRETFRLGDINLFGRSHFELIPDFPERWNAEYQRCLRGEAIERHEDYLERADGTSDWLWRELHPWYDETGEVGGIIIFNEIVTAWKGAEAELERNRQFLNAVLENVREGIYACDEEGRLTIFNSAGKHIVGADVANLRPEQWAEYYKVYNVDGNTLLRPAEVPLLRALNGEVIEDEEIVLAPKNQPRRHVLVNGQPLRSGSGARLGAVVSVHDITERREIEARYLQAQKMEAIGQLTGGLAHDFNNLLAVIIGNLQLLQRAGPADKKFAHRIGAAISAAQRGAELTDRLLAFARRQPLAAKPVDANARIADLADMLSRTLGEAIAIETKLEDKLWSICVDISQLEASIVNLAINARDAMQTGGRLTIETRNMRCDEARPSHHDLAPGDYVVISVSDSGCGMPEDVRVRAPEPFFTTKEVGKGSGLGLSVVYGFVEQSGGQLTIESEEGRGTTVTMYFPRSYEMVPDLGEQPRPIPKFGEQAKRILVVEDDPAVREIAVALLADLGYRTEEAPDGDAALEILRSPGEEFDLLLTDVVMPGRLNGPALVKAAREQFPDISVLFTSGYAKAAVLRESDLHGRVDLVSKPFRREELAVKVSQALRARPDREF